MNFMKLEECDTVNGEGIRITLYVSGCSHACDGCFNREAWNYGAGNRFDFETEEKIIALLKQDHISGLSILGGEPLAPQNINMVRDLCDSVRYSVPNKTIWLWSGYTLDEIKEKDSDILDFIDVLIDGKFVKELNKPNLLWKGSTNQVVHYLKERK